jgi:glycosyltransferase involved in cell wall biosynthesis
VTREAPSFPAVPPLTIATSLRPDGITGVQSYVRRLRRYLAEQGTPTALVTPFSWWRPITTPVFGVRLGLKHVSGAASTFWYRYWHEVFLRRALARHLADAGECVVYAQDPPSARAALAVRRGPHQRVAMVVHFRISQADEFADKEEIRRDGAVYRWIRQVEREVIPQVDCLVYMSRWAEEALTDWFPRARTVPSVVIGSTITPLREEPVREPIGDLVTIGNLDIVKNHRFLLTVLSEAKRRGREYTLDIYGEGPLQKDLLRQTRELGLEGQVRFRGFRPDARRFLTGYRAYVHAGYSESFCLAIVEGMAAGLPVLVGGIGPIPELCDDGVEGRFWPLDDPTRAAAILIDLLECEPERVRAAAAAEQRFRRDFDADVIIPRLMSFLAERSRSADVPSPAGREAAATRGVVSPVAQGPTGGVAP